METTALFLQQFTCGCRACISSCRRDNAQIGDCACEQGNGECTLDKRVQTGVAAQAKVRKEQALERARSLAVGDMIALETGDHRRLQREGGGTEHAFLVARVVARNGGGAYSIADDRAMRTNENEEYRVGDGLVNLRLFERDPDDETGRKFSVTDRLYLHCQRAEPRREGGGRGRWRGGQGGSRSHSWHLRERGPSLGAGPWPLRVEHCTSPLMARARLLG